MSDCRLAVTVRPARDADEVEAAQALRIRVFCDEQGVPVDEELDEFDRRTDATATHLVAVDEKSVVATCRLRRVGSDCKLERMAVERRHRGSGVGARLLAGAEAEAVDAGAERMILHAQTRAQRFYAASGYEPEGELFMEAEIEHVRMTKPLGGNAG